MLPVLFRRAGQQLMGAMRFAVAFLRLSTEHDIGPFTVDQLVAAGFIVGGLVLLRLPVQEGAH